MNLSKTFANECREEVKHYLSRAKSARLAGLCLSRRTFLKLALLNRANARKWSSEK